MAKRQPRGRQEEAPELSQEAAKRRSRGGQEKPQRSPRRGPEERRTTNDERRTTNDERRTTKDERRKTNDDRRTTTDERRRTNNGPPTLYTLTPDRPPAGGPLLVISGSHGCLCGRMYNEVIESNSIKKRTNKIARNLESDNNSRLIVSAVNDYSKSG